MFRSGAFLLLLGLLAACDPGFVRVQFEWPGGRPVLAPGDPASVFIRVEERSDVRVPGPVLTQLPPYPFVEERAQIPAIPYGERRVIVAEVRETATLDAQVLYYGLSEVFSVFQGDHVDVPVFMAPRAPPQVHVATGTTTGSLWILTEVDSPGFVRSSTVTLLLSTDTAAKVRISNVVGLPEAKSSVFSLSDLPPAAEAPLGQRSYLLSWRLDRGAELCLDPGFCRRTVYARYLDEADYVSRPVSAEVIEDTVAPEVVLGASSVEPAIARADSQLVVSLTTSETLRHAPEIWLDGGHDFPFVRAFPREDRRSNVFTFVASRAASVLGSRGTFMVRARLMDIAGNEANDAEVGSFTLDTPAPGLGGLVVEPPRINGRPGGQVRVRFSMDDALAGGRFAVTLGGREMDRCETAGQPPSVAVSCVRAMRGDELTFGSESIEPVLVEALDAAGNVARLAGSVIFDFKPPGLTDVSFSPPVAREGNTAYLLVSTDERLSPAVEPRFVWAQGRDPGLQYFSTTGLSASFGRLIDASVSEGTYTLSRVQLTDLAGNTATVAPSSPVVLVVDKSPPMLSGLTVTPRRIGKTGRVAVRFLAGERLSPSVSLGGRVMSCTSSSAGSGLVFSCARAMVGDEIAAGVEAVQSVVVDAADEAGNSARLSASMVFDFRPPSLTAASFSPPAVREGLVAQLVLTVDEALASGAPRLVFEGGRDPGFSFVSSSGLGASFELHVTRDTPEGTFTLLGADLSDAYGNRGDARLAASARVVVDRQPPRVTAFSVSPSRIGTQGTVQVSFDLAEVLPADAAKVWVGGRPMTCVQSGATAPVHHRCTWAMTPAVAGSYPDQEVSQPVIVDVTDAAGNATRTTGSVVFDFRAPHVVAAAVRVTPALGSLVWQLPAGTVTVDRLGIGGTASLQFSLDEAPASDPVVETRTPARLTFTKASSGGLSYSYQHVLGGSPAQGAYAIEVRVTDGVGNSATRALSLPAPGLVVDTVRPRAPDALRFTHDRYPYGSAQSSESGASVRASAGAAEPSSVVLVLSDPGLQSVALLQSAQVAPDGAVAAVGLKALRDHPEVYVTVVDHAGNESLSAAGVAGLATRVRRGTWTAGFRQGSGGAWGQNPNRAQVVGWAEPFLEQRQEVTEEATATQLAALASADGNVLRAATTPWAWEHVQVPVDAPSPRRRAASAVDTRRGRVVMFGGVADDGRLLGDTWEWEGQRWVQRAGPGPDVPAPRWLATMAYDSVRGRTVLFGGETRLATVTEPSVPANDTWEWDGARWTRMVPTAAAPPARAEHMMVYDAARAEVVMFGGQNDGLWRWDGARWLEVPRTAVVGPNGWPLARSTAAMCFDPVAERIVMFGGAELSGGNLLSDLWSWDGKGWVLRVLPATAPIPARPSARRGAACAFDAAHRSLLFYGGQTAGPTAVGELWELGVDWRRLVPPTGLLEPGARGWANLVFDPRRQEILMFGGSSPSFTGQADTWAWSGARWQNLTPSGRTPIGRKGHAMAYDPRNREVVAFGGERVDFSLEEKVLGDTWTWNGSRLEEHVSTQGPSPRTEAAMVATASEVYLFGGAYSTGVLGDGWSWNGRAWTQKHETVRVCAVGPGGPSPMLPGSPPLPRRGHGMAFDSARNRVVVFGGSVLDDQTCVMTYANDLVEFDGTTWTRPVVAASARPAARGLAGMVYNEASRSVFLFGGRDGTRVYNDTRFWNGTAWTLPLLTARPARRSSPGMVYDSARQRVVVVGGVDLIGDSVLDMREYRGSWEALPVAIDPPGPDLQSMGLTLGAAHDARRKRLVIFGGREERRDFQLWELHADSEQRPALDLRFDLARAGLERMAVTAIALRAEAGARGFATGSSPPAVLRPGIVVAGWNVETSAWVGLAQSGSDVTPGGPLTIGVTGAPSAQALVSSDRALVVRFSSAAGVGSGPATAEVGVDTAELTVSYAYPP